MSNTSSTWPYPRVIAHRGGGHFAPENTLAAMRLGAQRGFTMVEYDVKLSSDDIAILLHDDKVDRTSNGSGEAGAMTYRELATLDFGAWHSARYAGEPIPTLYAIAAFTQHNGILSNVEIKPHTGTDDHTGTLVTRMVRLMWAHAKVPPLLSSFSEKALEAALREAPELPRALLVEAELPSDWRGRMAFLQCAALNMNQRHVTPDIIAHAHEAGYRITAWTVNDTVRARELLDWGCDAIFTDEIEAIPASI
jgi:glycerophosphoryl diester phosphodiesterase